MTEVQQMMQFLGIKDIRDVYKCDKYIELKKDLQSGLRFRQTIAATVNCEGLVVICKETNGLIGVYTYQISDDILVCVREQDFYPA